MFPGLLRRLFNTKRFKKRTSNMEKDKGFVCADCQTRFSFRTNLNRHVRTIHNKATVRERTPCTVAGCPAKFYHRTKLLSHLEAAHGRKTDKVELSFAGAEEFLSWKTREEAENYVCFTKQRGDIDHPSATHQHYICQRDGRSRSHTSGGQPARKTGRRSRRGVIKTDLACPARMLARRCKKSGRLSVSYYKLHSHPVTSQDAAHHPLPAYARSEIKSKLRAGIPVDQIQREFQSRGQAQLRASGTRDVRLQRINRAQLRAIQRRMERREPEANRADRDAGGVAGAIPPGVHNDSGHDSDGLEAGNGRLETVARDATQSDADPSLQHNVAFTGPVSTAAYDPPDPGYGEKPLAMLKEMLALMKDENVRRTLLPRIMGNLEKMLALCRQEANTLNECETNTMTLNPSSNTP